MRVFSSVFAVPRNKNSTVPQIRTNVRIVFFMKYCCAWKMNYVRREASSMKISIFFMGVLL